MRKLFYLALFFLLCPFNSYAEYLGTPFVSDHKTYYSPGCSERIVKFDWERDVIKKCGQPDRSFQKNQTNPYTGLTKHFLVYEYAVDKRRTLYVQFLLGQVSKVFVDEE